MANHSSAKKAIRKTKRNSLINKSRKSCIKTYIKNVLIAVKSGNIEQAKGSFIKAQSVIMKGVSCKLVKKNTASRKISKLAKKVKLMMSV